MKRVLKYFLGQKSKKTHRITLPYSRPLSGAAKNTTEKISKQDTAIKTIETNTNATLQLYRKEIDDLKNQQANDHVMSECQSRKYNLIVHNLREDHGNIGRVTLFLSTE